MNIVKKIEYKLKTKNVGLKSGWHILEEDKNSYFRWTKKEAKFIIKEEIESISIKCSSNRKTKIKIILNNFERKYLLKKDKDKIISIPVNSKDVSVKILTENLFKTPNQRLLGIKVKMISFKNKKDQIKEIDLRKTLGKRIVVITSQVPFEKGGNEFLAEFLVKKLKEKGYNACMFYTPQNRHYKFKELLKGYISNYLIDLKAYNEKVIDQVISLKYPSFAVRHPNHVCWFNHRQREYYDLWPFWIKEEIKNGRGFKRKIEKKIIHQLDKLLLKNNINKVFAQSKTIQDRLNKWGSIKSEVLYAPPIKDSKFYCKSYENYIFTISRLCSYKRIDLLIKAFKYVKSKKIKCIIAGKGEDKNKLMHLIKKNKLENRIKLIGFVSDKKANDYLANCRGVFFGPLNEDYGLVTLEAMKSKKCIITCNDSGGPTEFVKSGNNGFIVKTDPKEIAKKIDLLAKDKKLAKKLGENAYKSVKSINWDDTIKQLVQI